MTSLLHHLQNLPHLLLFHFHKRNQCEFLQLLSGSYFHFLQTRLLLFHFFNSLFNFLGNLSSLKSFSVSLLCSFYLLNFHFFWFAVVLTALYKNFDPFHFPDSTVLLHCYGSPFLISTFLFLLVFSWPSCFFLPPFLWIVINYFPTTPNENACSLIAIHLTFGE